MNFALLAAALLSLDTGSAVLDIESDTTEIDPGRSVFLTVKTSGPDALKISPPDLRGRLVGFSLAEDFADEPVKNQDGTCSVTVNWRLVPEPCAEVYKIKPFAFNGKVAGPVYFKAFSPRTPVEGGMEVDPQKDLPPLSWKLAGLGAAVLCGMALIVFLVCLAVRYLVRRVREHRMSPIERAWAELDRLVKKGLPSRGRFKDFYVELTMVVRRYIQRKYGIKAPHMTTEEFLCEARPSDELRRFLESSDLVKFAGVEATPAMADEATESARNYLKSDDAGVEGVAK